MVRIQRSFYDDADSDDEDAGVVALKWGLAFGDISQEYGFCYLHEGIFDWVNNNFQEGVADHFKEPSKFITMYRARSQKRKEINTILQDIDLVIGRLLAESCASKRKFYIHFLQIRVLWQYFSDVWEQVWENASLHFRAKRLRQVKENRARQLERQPQRQDEGKEQENETAMDGDPED